MFSRGKSIVLITTWTLVLLFSAYTRAEEDHVYSGCIQYARKWIQQLDQTSWSDVLIRNTRSDCEFSAGWIKKSSDNENSKNWSRMCNDLVLIWTHKKCIHYRDYIDHNAYTPCKEWTRQMYRHCMNHNETWFY